MIRPDQISPAGAAANLGLAAAAFCGLSLALLNAGLLGRPLTSQWWLALLLAIAVAVLAYPYLALQRRLLTLQSRLSRALSGTRVRERDEFLQLLAAEVERGKRYGDPFSVILVRAQGIPAQRLPSLLGEIRATDVAAELGEDRLVLLLPATRRHEAERMAERLAERLRAGGTQACLGLTGFDGSTRDCDSVLDRAETALQLAEEPGRGLAYR